MANLEKSLNLIRHTQADYYGISRKFFPKWAGWEEYDLGLKPNDKYVKDFYKEFFWDRLLLDLVESQDISDLIFLFSTKCGKKKLVQKLDRIFDTSSDGCMTAELVQCLNKSDQEKIFLLLYAELVEFLWMIERKQDFLEILKVYNKFCQSI